MSFTPKTRSEILREIYYTVKIYPNFIRVYEYPEYIIKQDDLYSPTKKIATGARVPKDDPYIFDVSIKRSRTKLQDLCLSNDFDLFASDRQSISLCKSKMRDWLKSQQKRYGSFDYIIVPEFHKDGKSLHFHALFKSYKGRLTQAINHKTHKPLKQNGRSVYNIKSYKSGYSTAVKIDNMQKVSSYIRKYITKDMPRLSNKKRYWCSTKLQRPQVIQNFDFNEKNLNLNFTTLYEKNGFTIYHADGTI
jgi:hypothetical protein